MTFLSGTNRGLGGLQVEQGSTDVFGVNHIVFTGATLTDNGNGKVTVAISGGGGGGMTTWTIAGASGSTVVNDGETVTITGSSGITTAESGRTVTITPTGVLEDLNTLGAPSANGEFIVATGAGAFSYESGATARTSLGLGTIATQDANAVAITGGSITNVPDVLPSIANSLTLTSGATQVLTDAESGFIIYCDASTSDITIDFDPAISANVQFTIIQIGTGANINIVPSAGTVNGVASVALTIQYNAATVVALNPNTFFAIGV